MNSTAALIVVLEDDLRRIEALRNVVELHLGGVSCKVFDSAHVMVYWLKEHISEVCLISLDHDLGPNRIIDGNVHDPGSGMEVVDYLITNRPSCPVIIHSSNSNAVQRMKSALDASGWKSECIVPFDDLSWIEHEWQVLAGQLLKR
ncbi:MAG: cyclic-phosphate processing receiver domain-containing protein [Thermoleophilia bacterium]